jgi:general secretion pathway protein M
MASIFTGGLGGFWQRLATRERRLLLLLAVVVGGGVFASVTMTIVGGISSLEAHNAQEREALHDLDVHRDQLAALLAANSALESRLDTPAPALTGYVDQAAKDVGITLPEIKENPPQPLGKYTEDSVAIHVEGISISQLGAFMTEIENGQHLVLVKELDVDPRFNQHDQLDVNMVIATYAAAPITGPQGAPVKPQGPT